MPRSYAKDKMPDEPEGENTEGHMPRSYATDEQPAGPATEPKGIRLRATDEGNDSADDDAQGHTDRS